MIGIFDSGVGGLTVARAVLDQLPGYDIIYLGDTARTPYGNKSPETIVTYSIENIKFLQQRGAKLIIVACNSASSVIDRVREEIKDIPIFDVIDPAVYSIANARFARVGVIGTRATIRSNVYADKIRQVLPNVLVHSIACPLLATLVEEGWGAKPETAMIVRKYIRPFKDRRIEALVLGCTHYPLLSSCIKQSIGSRVKLIDSSLAVAERVAAFLQEDLDLDRRLGKTGALKLFVSDITDHFATFASQILGKKVNLLSQS